MLCAVWGQGEVTGCIGSCTTGRMCMQFPPLCACYRSMQPRLACRVPAALSVWTASRPRAHDHSICACHMRLYYGVLCVLVVLLVLHGRLTVFGQNVQQRVA